MTTSTPISQASDSELWQRVLEGNAPAFEVLVQRHQSLVCAVAYNACGNLAMSEDVAQETFWTAWRERTSLQEPARLRNWLCGIARNVGQNARRRGARPADSASSLDSATELAANDPEPGEEMASREEAALVWQTLEQIPELYREPLILFYREQQAVAEVAQALDLSEDAVKQRLCRGRDMLRAGVAELVEGVLQRSRPGRRLTVAVMAGLSVMSTGVKTAVAGAAGKAASGMAGPALKAVSASGSAGVLGGILGPLLGLGGGWLGTWVPAQLAPAKRERDYLLRTGRRIFFVSVLLTVLLIGASQTLPERLPHGYFVFFFLAWMAAFWTYLLLECVPMNREIKRIRADRANAEPNDAPLRLGMNALVAPYRGRVYRSKARFLGLPLIDVNVNDPVPPGADPRERRFARGWIAVGDDARGVLLAIGSSTAMGGIALGGRAIGVMSFGGLAVGVLSAGGLAVGGLAIGGLAVGWQAVGGGAVAWDVAVGGGAVALRAAFGGGALAHDFAVGGGVQALHANDAAARAVLLDHPLRQGMEWYAANAAWVTPLYALLLVLGCLAMIPLKYRRERNIGSPNEFSSPPDPPAR